MLSLWSALTFATLASLASTKTIKITATSDNTFDPDSIEADKDDVLEFHFEAKNHSVVAGDYQYPCSPLDLGSGFFSGFISTDSGTAVCYQSLIVALLFTTLHSRSATGQSLPGHHQRHGTHCFLLLPR
jgi:hypothetical protein